MEFHAVILFHDTRGTHNKSQLSSLTTRNGNECFLPVANKPILQYMLDWCLKAQFSKISLVVEDGKSAEFSEFVQNNYANVKDRISVKTESLNVDEEVAPNKDLVVMTRTSFITEVDPNAVVNYHRLRDEEIAVTSLYYKESNGSKDNRDYVIHSPFRGNDSECYLFDSYNKHNLKNGLLKVRSSLLIKHGNVSVSTQLKPTGIYLCSRKVLSLFKEPSSSISLSQNWDRLMRNVARDSWLHSHSTHKVAFKSLTQTEFIEINNQANYLEAMRMLMKPQKGPRSSRPDTKSTNVITGIVGADSIIGTENVRVGDKSSVKKSSISNNASIGKNCRITGSVIMEGAIVEDNVVIENTLVGPHAKVHSKSKLSNCTVGQSFIIVAGTISKNETFQNDIEGFASDEELGSVNDEDSDSGSNESESEEDYSDDEEDESDVEDDGLFDRS